MTLTDYAFRNKPLVYFFLFVLIAGGIFSFFSMSKLEDPEIKVKKALVITVYPGASAHEVEMEVTDLLEKSIRSMGGLDHVSSRSMANYSEILVELKSTVKEEEIEQKWDILRRKVSNAQGGLPEGVRPSMVFDDFGDVSGIFYAMTSDGFSYSEMTRYANLVKRELENIDGVNRVIVYGEQKPCVNVEIKKDKMANLGVHPLEVVSTLKDLNQKVYAGYFDSGDKHVRISVNNTFKSVKDIGDLIIQGHEQDRLRLKDIAEVTKGYTEPARTQMYYDSLPAIGIAISMESGGNIIELGKEIDKHLAELKSTRVPEGIEFRKVFFQPEKVNDAIKNFMINLLESLAIVVFILMLTMGFRSGVIIGSGLLITILGSFVVLNFFGGTLQRVSLASLIVAMGMLVDNAIVILDGILVDLKSGKKKSEALFNTARKTAWPLLGATVIAIVAFLPIFLSPDTTGDYVRDLFIVLAVSLLLSWVLALTHIPVYADKRFKEMPKGDEPEELYTGKIYVSFRKSLDFMLRHKVLTVSFTVALLVLSGFLFKFVKQGFFPDLSYKQLYIEYKMPEGTRVGKVRSDLEEIRNYLMSKKEITHVTTSIGGTPARYNLVRSIAERSTSYGELIVDFTSPDILKSSIPQLQKYLTDNYPDAYIRIKRYNLMYKKFPIEVMFSGPDPAVLKNLASQAKKIMEEEPTAALVTDDWEPMAPLLVAGYDQPAARLAGVSRQDVGIALMTAYGGIPVGNYHEGTQTLPIYFKDVDMDGKNIKDPATVPVWSMLPSPGLLTDDVLKSILAGVVTQEGMIDRLLDAKPLKQVVGDVKVEWEEPVVRRYNGQRAIKAQCNNVTGYSVESVRRKLKEKIEKLYLPAGYSLSWHGEYEASTKSKKYLFGYLPLAIILMIGILTGLFRDFKKPLIIILSLPLAMIGIVSGMLLFGKEFGFVAIVGALGLIGMMIKNGVVLIEEIEYQIQGGKEMHQALIDSSSSRFRPVMMASLTTILGMIPLLPDDMFGSMAVTMMSGLLIGTLITLIFIPVLYALIMKSPEKES